MSGILKVIPIHTHRLSEILEKYLPEETTIDFLSVDAEGLDLEVIRSNNWEKYRPDYVLVEIAGIDLDEIDNHEIANFLKQHNYKVLCKTFNTVFFKRENNDRGYSRMVMGKCNTKIKS